MTPCLSTFMTTAAAILASTFGPWCFAAEKELFDARRDLVVGAETDFAQKESTGLIGYDLALHNNDITQYKRDWFDLACQFRPKEGEKWFHIVDGAGAAVEDGSMNAYCDNTVAMNAMAAPARYLLLGYTPQAPDARDGSGLKKNFALLMRGVVRQDILDDTQKNGEAHFTIDGYLFDRPLSRLVASYGRGRELPGLGRFCSHLEKGAGAENAGRCGWWISQRS